MSCVVVYVWGLVCLLFPRLLLVVGCWFCCLMFNVHSLMFDGCWLLVVFGSCRMRVVC